jgi:hypothetical protein
MELRGRSIWMNQQYLRQMGFQKRVMLPFIFTRCLFAWGLPGNHLPMAELFARMVRFLPAFLAA